jgi:D-serine dehydratase
MVNEQTAVAPAPGDENDRVSEVAQPNRLNLEPIVSETIDWRFKGFPPTHRTVTVGDVGDQGWNALAGDLLFPIMALKEKALDHNIRLMAQYCQEHGLSLAPHGKTPVAPQIVQRQLDAGAWGVTAATIQQVRVFRACGVQRILLANELVEPLAIQWIADEMQSHPDFLFLCLADSTDQVAILDQVLAGTSGERPLRVLIELGMPGGRAGARTVETAKSVAVAIAASAHLELAGVEGYEGPILKGDPLDDTVAAVDRYFLDVRDLTMQLERDGLFDGLDEIVVSVGGSVFFDRVAEMLAPPWGVARAVRLVSRSGSYVTHDVSSHERLSPLASRGESTDRLQPALELWASILSAPEPGLAIAGFGRRDAPQDSGLPVPFALRHRGEMRNIRGQAEVTALNDQHAFIRLEAGIDVAPGDLMGCYPLHPCTTFDRWPLLPMVDEDYRITGAVRTYF